MVEKSIVYIFKIIAVTVISILLWAFFIGKPSEASEATTTQTYATQGSAFEEFVYKTSFDRLCLSNYLQNTGNSGYNLWYAKRVDFPFNSKTLVTQSDPVTGGFTYFTV